MSHRRDALVTFVVLFLVYAAFDDITTDNATAFPVEYTMLILAAIWLAFVSVRLLRERHRLLGAISLLALGGAVWGQRAIGQGLPPGWRPGSVTVVAAYLWFLMLSVALLWLARADKTAARTLRPL